MWLAVEEPCCKNRALGSAKSSANVQFIAASCLKRLGWSVFFEKLLSCQPWHLVKH